MYLGNHGWIDLKGKFHKLKYNEYHCNMAATFIIKMKLYDKYTNSRIFVSPSEFLENMGWIRVQGDRNDISISNIWFKNPNKQQMITIRKICQLYYIDINVVTKCNYENV